MYKQLFGHLATIIPLSNDLKTRLSQALVTKTIKKMDYLLSEGQVCNHILFIEKGLVKTFYLKEGREICSSFVKENEVAISVKSFYTRQPGDEIIQALENSTVHYLHYNDLQEIYRKHIEFNIIGRMLSEKHNVASEERLFLMRSKTAKARFSFMLEHHPELVGRVQKRDLASYLGISASTISRIRPNKK